MKKLVVVVCVLAGLIWACEDKIENPALVVSPSDYVMEADTNQLIKFIITASAYEKRSLKTFRIKYSTRSELPVALLDSSLNGISKFNHEFYYRVPKFTDTTEVKLEFYVADDAGNIAQLARILIVATHTESGDLLTEFAGNTLYCDPNQHGTAFNLLKCELLSKNSTDSANMHLLADTVLSGGFSRRWLSPAKLKFVAFNGLDYAKATAQSAKAAYDAGAKTDFIPNVNENDIYITRIMENTVPRYIVVRVMNIYDNAGTQDDRFIFNVKK